MTESGVINLKDTTSELTPALNYCQTKTKMDFSLTDFLFSGGADVRAVNEPPGACARVALAGLTVAEYCFDQEGQDVLVFIDNIFRFTRAGSEISALLGRIPSAVGYGHGYNAGKNHLHKERLDPLSTSEMVMFSEYRNRKF